MIDESIEVVWHSQHMLASEDLTIEDGIEIRNYGPGTVEVTAWRAGSKRAGWVIDARAEHLDDEIRSAIDRAKHRLISTRHSAGDPS